MSSELNLKKKNKKIKKKSKKVKKITIINSLKENYISWVLIFCVVIILSYSNILAGVFTFLLAFLLAYISHYFVHFNRNIFTIIHYYHHENDNLLSHYSEVLFELIVNVPAIIIHNLCHKYFFSNPWIILFTVFFYTSVHNINYGCLKVNNVHKTHHKYIKTNLGPDVCDILFGTKNPKDNYVENTNHYIPNIIISFIIVLFLKYLWNNDENKIILTFFATSLSIIIVLMVSFLSIYLWLTDEKYKKISSSNNNIP